MEVYKAINAVALDLAQEGIAKSRKNAQQGYNFRGIDDVYNVLAPLLPKHHLCILPRFTEATCVERTSLKGGALFYVTVKGEFDFVSAIDGSKHTIVTFGEAMDSADKATNKAMSAAYKYAAFQAFAIPTEGDNDADAQTHEVAPQPTPLKRGLANCISEAQGRKLYAKCKAAGIEVNDLMAHYKITRLGELHADLMESALEWIAGRPM